MATPTNDAVEDSTAMEESTAAPPAVAGASRPSSIDLSKIGLDERRLGWTKKVFDKYVEPSGHISLQDFGAICHMVDDRLVPDVVERTFETAGAVDGRIDETGFAMWVGLMFGYCDDEEFDEVMGELHDPDSVLGPLEPPKSPGGTVVEVLSPPLAEMSPRAKLTQEVESLRQMNLVKDARIEALEAKIASMEHSYNTLLEALSPPRRCSAPHVDTRG